MHELINVKKFFNVKSKTKLIYIYKYIYIYIYIYNLKQFNIYNSEQDIDLIKGQVKISLQRLIRKYSPATICQSNTCN